MGVPVSDLLTQLLAPTVLVGALGAFPEADEVLVVVVVERGSGRHDAGGVRQGRVHGHDAGARSSTVTVQWRTTAPIVHVVVDRGARVRGSVALALVVVVVAGCTSDSGDGVASGAVTSPSPAADAVEEPSSSPTPVDDPITGTFPPQRHLIGYRGFEVRRGPTTLLEDRVVVTGEFVNARAGDIVFLQAADAVAAILPRSDRRLPLRAGELSFPVVVPPGARITFSLVFDGGVPTDEPWITFDFHDQVEDQAEGADPHVLATDWATRLDEAGAMTDEIRAGTVDLTTQSEIQTTVPRRDGLTVRATQLEAARDGIYVTLVATNARDVPAELLAEPGLGTMYDDRLVQLTVSPPQDNPSLTVGPQEELTVRLGFLGRVAEGADTVSVYLNHDGQEPISEYDQDGDRTPPLRFPNLRLPQETTTVEVEDPPETSRVTIDTGDLTSSAEARALEVVSTFEGRAIDDGTLLTVPEEVLFDFDEATLRDDAIPVLEELLVAVEYFDDAPVRITGHTDDRGEEAYNQDLSERRAEAVRAWFVDAGTEASRLTADGEGESSPVAANDTAAGRQANRRVELVLVGVDVGDDR